MRQAGQSERFETLLFVWHFSLSGHLRWAVFSLLRLKKVLQKKYVSCAGLSLRLAMCELTLHASHVITPKWVPDEGARHT
jgi:hypothetical protein